MPTYCSECDHCMKDHKSAPEYTWTCLRFPRLESGFLSPTVRDSNLPPYMHCKNINGGACPLFKPKATSQTNLPLKEEN